MKDLLLHSPQSPLRELTDSLLTVRHVRLWVKRDDLLAQRAEDAFCGNKWRKLQYNLLEAKQFQIRTLLTFGGAYSNHLAAVAQAGALFDFATIGVVRSEADSKALNPTLQFCADCGMQLHFVSRAAYRAKNDPAFLAQLRNLFGEHYLLPEGGTNALAIKGCAALPAEIQEQMEGNLPDYIAVACGTGGTLAGIVQGLVGRSQVLGFSVLKGDFLEQEVVRLLSANGTNWHNWQINREYHFGGYAKFQPALIEFINHFRQQHAIPLDPIYTGKLFFGLFDLIDRGYFPSGSTIVAVHTGGLQGIAGFNARFGNIIV